jgi:Domain of unknown function (DUF4390)
MTTTGFFWRCLKNVRLEWAALLVCAACLVGAPLKALAAPGDPQPAAGAEISQLQIERSPDGVYLTAAIRFELPGAVEDALQKGVPLFFVAEADVFRSRWYWYDKRLISAERHFRLAYQPLTRRWRINTASGAINSGSLGLSLGQNFDSLPEAMAAIKRIAGWKIGDAADIESDPRNSVEFRFRLDLTQLPRPFQIGVVGQSEWNIFASAVQPLGVSATR